MDVPKLLAFIAASFTGKTRGGRMPTEVERMKILEELKLILTKIDVLALVHADAAPPLSYLVTTLLKTTCSSSEYSPKLRIMATEILLILVKRLPSDDFIVSIVPGSLSLILKFFTSLEKERGELVALVVGVARELINRGFGVILKDKKLSTIIGKIYSVVKKEYIMDAGVQNLFLGLVIDIFEQMKKLNLFEQYPNVDEDVFVLCRCFALINDTSISDHSSIIKSDLVPLCRLALDEALEQLFMKNDMNIGILKEIKALLEVVPKEQWPDLSPLISFCVPHFKLPHFHSGFVVDLKDIYTGHDATSSCIFDLFSAINSHSSSLTIFIDASNDIAVDDHLFFLGAWLSGIQRVEDFEYFLDFLTDQFNQFSVQPYSSDSDDSVKLIDERSFNVSWCCAAFQFCQSYVGSFPIESKSSSDSKAILNVCTPSSAPLLSFLIKPALAIASSMDFYSREAGNQLLSTIAGCFNLETVGDLLNSQYQNLLDQIFIEIRYPHLYPQAPIQLAAVIKQTRGNIQDLSSCLINAVADLEEMASKHQMHPGYILSLLMTFRTILGHHLSSSNTMLPTIALLEDSNVDPILSLEQQLASSIIKVTLHFITSDEDRIRIWAIQVLSEAVEVFKSCPDAILPLVHLTWAPFLARLFDDNNPEVILSVLRTISRQAEIAGEFMRDRIQKEFFPKIATIKVIQEAAAEVLQILISILVNIGKASSSLIKSMVWMVVKLCGAELDVQTAGDLMAKLISIDPDQVWFVLFVVLGPNTELSAPSVDDGDHRLHRLFPAIDLRPFKDPLLTYTALSNAQRKLVDQIAHNL